MGYPTVDLTDLGGLAATRLLNVDKLDDEVDLGAGISSDSCFEGIIGQSPALQNALEQAAIVATTDSTVLLLGETGTGKELIARAIHNLSSRRERIFVRMNCAAIPSGLLESELFGHEKGAFTGALMQKKGRFELADRGSLFLDEIGDISLELQPKLLRALQDREFERLGSVQTRKVDFRLIAATNRDLDKMVADGQFRSDLYYRLHVFPIRIPPLRERREDIPALVRHFVQKSAKQMHKKIESIPAVVMNGLTARNWPGNIRELENFIERAVILTRGNALEVPLSELRKTAEDQPVIERAFILSQASELNVPLAEPRKSSSQAPTFTPKFHDIERNTIVDALKVASGKLAGPGGAAERLGLKRTTLQNKMRRLQISKTDYQPSLPILV